VRVLKSGSLWLALLLALAGCSTAPRQGSVPPPSWGPTPAGVVTNAPVLSKPPGKPAKPQPPAPAPAPAFAPMPANLTAMEWIPLDRWSQLNGLHPPQRFPGQTQVSYTISTPRGVLALKSNSHIARWNGMELQLGFPTEETNGHLLVNSLDAQKTFSPLLEPFSLPLKDHRVIVLDPGHGGSNTGTKSVLGNHFEKEYTLDWAKRLKPLLEAGGWTVYLTRTNDVEVSLSNRVTFAEAHHADFFLSLHFNAPPRPNPEPNGLETYCLTPVGMPSNLTRDPDDDITQFFPNNNFDSQNLQYALRLHRALLEVNGGADRGICHARFIGVLRRQNRPAILIEGGFLSNPREAKRIADPAYRQKLAEAVAGALTENNPAAAFSLAPDGLRDTTSKP
jgi:N-acetylmuramoyl-L-alanine amidase